MKASGFYYPQQVKNLAIAPAEPEVGIMKPEIACYEIVSNEIDGGGGNTV